MNDTTKRRASVLANWTRQAAEQNLTDDNYMVVTVDLFDRRGQLLGRGKISEMDVPSNRENHHEHIGLTRLKALIRGLA